MTGGDAETIAVVGCGYVGLVTAVGLAEQGIRVRAYDVDAGRVEALRALNVPMLEPGLEESMRTSGDRLTFHDTGVESWARSDITFMAVPTPQSETGYPNLAYLRRALEWIAASDEPADSETILVIRSTVPPGTARWARSEIRRLIGGDVPVLANPEFLQEGRALADFRAPSRIVIGSDDADAARRLEALMSFTDAPVIVTDTSTAELAKYGSNAFLAVRVSFANEMARLAEREGADPTVVLRAVGLDPRLGSRYLQPGLGYGGSCLPKDVAALISMGDAVDEPMELFKATQEVNELQRRRVVRLLAERLDGLGGRRIAVLGLAFKPGTNDIRESPGVHIATELMAAGADVIAWDPAVTEAHIAAAGVPIRIDSDILRSAKGADALVLSTEWTEAVEIDLDAAARVMRGTLLVDGRYQWDARLAASAGLELARIGQPSPAGPGTVS